MLRENLTSLFTNHFCTGAKITTRTVTGTLFPPVQVDAVALFLATVECMTSGAGARVEDITKAGDELSSRAKSTLAQDVISSSRWRGSPL